MLKRKAIRVLFWSSVNPKCRQNSMKPVCCSDSAAKHEPGGKVKGCTNFQWFILTKIVVFLLHASDLNSSAPPLPRGSGPVLNLPWQICLNTFTATKISFYIVSKTNLSVCRFCFCLREKPRLSHCTRFSTCHSRIHTLITAIMAPSQQGAVYVHDGSLLLLPGTPK